MWSATLIITFAICSVALGIPNRVPRASRVLNHEPMTEKKLQDLVKHHMAGVSEDLKHNDDVVSGLFLLTDFVFFSFLLFSFFLSVLRLLSNHRLSDCQFCHQYPELESIPIIA